MKDMTRNSLVLTAALAVMFGLASSVDALPGAKPKGATLQDVGTKLSNPEIDAAQTRVEQAKAQVELANKQVNASRALLKAAQADLKAATTHLDALRLTANAQGLVNETGMTPAKAPPVSIATKAEPTEEKKEAPAETATTEPATAPAPAPSTEGTRIGGDFNSEQAPSEPIQLR